MSEKRSVVVVAFHSPWGLCPDDDSDGYCEIKNWYMIICYLAASSGPQGDVDVLTQFSSFPASRCACVLHEDSESQLRVPGALWDINSVNGTSGTQPPAVSVAAPAAYEYVIPGILRQQE